MTIHIVSRMASALREGYFGRTFITGKMFRAADRHGSPIPFRLRFAAHMIPALMFLGIAGLFGWLIVSKLLGA